MLSMFAFSNVFHLFKTIGYAPPLQVAAPLANTDKITVVDTGGNGSEGGANKITGYATNVKYRNAIQQP